MTNPVQEIEGIVLNEAARLRLDLEDEAGQPLLQQLIRRVVREWSEDFRRGRRQHDLADPETVAARCERNLIGYGPLESLLADDDVWEVMVNAPSEIFVKRHKGPSGYHDDVFHDDDHVTRTLTRILDNASGSHRKLDPTLGLQDAQLDDGSRLHIVHADVGAGGHTMVNIRRFTGVAFRDLRELVEGGTLSSRTAEFLRACALARLTVLFAGPPGSGKTTLLSCTAAELDPALRVVVAEEVFEADLQLPNVASMQTRPARPDRPAVDLRRLVAGFLRMAPDVAVVGEVRDTESLALLMTLSSGVKGYTTIHAHNARQALSRLRFISQISGIGDVPLAALNSLVAESIDIVVHSSRSAKGPRVEEIIAVEDPAGGYESTQFTVTELFTRGSDDRLEWTGQIPIRARSALGAVGFSFVPDEAEARAAVGVGR